MEAELNQILSPEEMDYLKFTPEDIDCIQRIDQMISLQYEAIEKDIAFREALQIDKAELDKMIEISTDSLGFNMKLVGTKLEHVPMTAEEKDEEITSIKSSQESDTETTEHYSEIISKLCVNSDINAGALIQSLKDKAVLFDVGRRIERYIRARSESHARELLTGLEKKAMEVCDRCFTTSQVGSGTRTKKTENTPQYDSIYFLYKISNGTYISQRFKRNLLAQAELHEVIQPVLDLALFTKEGGPSTLSEMRPGFYGKDKVQTEPEIGYYLSEYYSSENREHFREGNLAEISIPNVVSVTDQGVIIKEGFISAFDGGHEGSEVNSILK